MIFVLSYLFVLLFSLGSSSILSSLLAAEVLSWVFIQVINTYDSVKYLVVQSVFFLFSMVGLFWMKSLLVVGLILKMGLPPFHMWMIRLLGSMSKQSFFVVLTLHKLLPLLILAKMMKEETNILWLGLLLFLLSIMISNMSTMFLVLGLSSMVHSFWMVISSLAAASLLITYWAVYTSLSFIFIFSMSSQLMINSSIAQTLMTSFGWLLMSGIPPFTIFWLKAHVSFTALMETSFLLVWSLLLASVLVLSSYYRAWHFSSFISNRSLTGVQMITIFFLSFCGIFK